jgi:hypothetical protein
MGQDITGPWFANVKGGFEERSIFGINGRIIANAGGTWYDPPPVEAFYDSKLIKKFRSEIVTAIRLLQHEPIWGFKDPHHCFTAHMWHSFLPDPHYLVISRNPYSVARSLQERNKFDLAKGLHIQALHLEALSRFLGERQPPQIWVSYERLLAEPAQVCASISEFIDHEIDPEFIDPELDHHSKEASWLFPGPLSP